MNWNYDEMAATLRADMGGHPPVVCVANFTTGSQIVVGGGERSQTLLSRDYKDAQCVVVRYGCYGMDSRPPNPQDS